MGLLKFNLCIFFPALWLSLQPRCSVSPQTAGSVHLASQQGWSLSSNKPLSHRLMPADDKSPPTPAKQVGLTVCLIKPKGRDTAGHTAKERERQEGTEEEENVFFFFHHPFSGLPSVYRTWQPSLDFPALVSHLSPVSPSLFIFCLWWENVCNSICLTLSLFVASPALWPLNPQPQNYKFKELVA